MLQVSHFSKFSETLLYKNKKISYLFKNNGGPPSLQPAYKRKSPMLTELLPYQGTKTKKEDIPVLTGISSLT